MRGLNSVERGAGGVDHNDCPLSSPDLVGDENRLLRLKNIPHWLDSALCGSTTDLTSSLQSRCS